jgi:putative RecB family exonuclease
MSQEALSRDAVAQRRGGVWDYISPSRLNTWLACPLKFKLKYIDGVETATSPAAFLGKAVHKGLEDFYRHRQLGVCLAIDDVSRRLVQDWDEAVATESVVFGSVATESACRNQARALVKAYLRQVGGEEPRPLAVEVAADAPLIDPGNHEDLRIPLVGIMDLVLPAASGPAIVDFKTTTRSTAPLAVTHEIQLGCYSYLFRHVSPTPEGSLEIRNLIKTKVPQVQLHQFRARTDRHFSRLFAVIRAYLDDLDSGKFLFRPGLGCMMCDFRNMCGERD